MIRPRNRSSARTSPPVLEKNDSNWPRIHRKTKSPKSPPRPHRNRSCRSCRSRLPGATTAVFQGSDFDQRRPELAFRRRLRRSRASAPAGAAVNSQGRKPLDSVKSCSQPWKGDTKPERRHSYAEVIRVAPFPHYLQHEESSADDRQHEIEFDENHLWD